MSWIRRKTKSLFSRTLIGMLSISLTVLVLVAVVLFTWFRMEMVDGYHQLTQATIGNLEASFSRSVSDARSLTAEWYASADGTSLRLDENTDLVDHMSFVNKVMSALNNTTCYQSFYILGKQGQIMLDVGSSVSNPVKLDQLLVDKVTKEKVKNNPFVWNVARQYYESETISLLSIPVAEAAAGDSRFLGMAILNIDLSYLQKSLTADTGSGELRLLILDDSGQVVIHSDSGCIGENWSDKGWVQQILNRNKGFQGTEDGRRWEFQSMPTSIDGFYVVAQSEYAAQSLNINYVLYVFFRVIIIAAITIIIMMLLVSHHIFQPFTSMVKTMKQSQLMARNEADVPGGNSLSADDNDEVAFLQHFYHGMSTHLELLNQKEENNFIIKNLLLGTQREEIRQMLLQRGILTASQPYELILISVDNKQHREGYSMQEYDMLRSMVSNVYAALLGGCGSCSYFEVGLRRLLFVVSDDSTGSDARALTGAKDTARFAQMVWNALQQAEGSVRKLAQVRTYTLISEPLQDEGQFCVRRFAEISDCMKTRQILQKEEIAVYPAERKKENGTELYVEAMLTALKQRDHDAYLQAFSAFLDACALLSYPRFLDRVEQAAWAVSKVGHVTKASIQENLASITSREELILWMDGLYNEAAIQISRVNSHSTAAMMEEAIDYIRSHYDDGNLNVNLLADKLGISAAYFGKLFNEFTGSKTLEYILKVRMERAHDMLMSEQGKDIAEIAAAVGYNNSAYFATAFKKYYGFTPSAFREYCIKSAIQQEKTE